MNPLLRTQRSLAGLRDTLNAVRDDISMKLGQAESVRVARDNTRGELPQWSRFDASKRLCAS